VLTIYEKESLFESLDESFTEIKAYVEGAVGQEALHEVKLHLFRRLQRLGRGFMERFISLSGTGYEVGSPRFSTDGRPLKYKGTGPKVRLMCLFLAKSRSIVRRMPIWTGGGSIRSMPR